MYDYIIAGTDEDYRNAAKLFKEYAAWLNIDLSFQYFEEELQELKTMYAAPGGGIILSKNGNDYIASVAIRKINNKTAELKKNVCTTYLSGSGNWKNIIGKSNRVCQVGKLLLHKIRYAEPYVAGN